MTKRADSVKYIIGGKGSDNLKGSAGNDVMVGRAGDDPIQGGAGRDVLYGDDISGGKFWGCKFGGWRHGWGAGNDFLDGGAGSDLVFGGRGNDVLQYSMAGNLGASFANVGAHDVYDGGKGFDTLKLQLTHGENLLHSVQADIAAFKAFLASRANPHSEHGKTFHFKTAELDFEVAAAQHELDQFAHADGQVDFHERQKGVKAQWHRALGSHGRNIRGHPQKPNCDLLEKLLSEKQRQIHPRAGPLSREKFHE